MIHFGVQSKVDPMDTSVSSLTLQFLSWVEQRPRSYAEAMDAWRTSCPRLTIWEDALIDGLVAIESGNATTRDQSRVTLTPRGRAMLDGKQ
jgi:hypothetical protein